ncbi:alpha/beta fold hydrolase [Streptomyces sediminimaris]|uniref:alpha/beta fold hydrolase n=1 Tax=Streptomyces sediminimaris TaxID=3383721 RepID=UPI003999AC93
MTHTTWIPLPDGNRLAADTAGDGPAVILLHAGIADRRMWDQQVRAVLQHHRVIRYDQRGFGRSPAPTAPFAPVSDLMAVLDHFDVRSATLVGASLGGRIAVDFAIQHPDRTRSLVLAAPGITGIPLPPGKQAAAFAEAAARRDFTRFVDIAVRLWAPLAPHSETTLTIRRMITDNLTGFTLPPDLSRWGSPPATQRLHELCCPVDLITAIHDTPHAAKVARSIADALPAQQLICHSLDSDHLIPVRAAASFNALLLQALSRA